MKHFREITTGQTIVMWYNTYASIGKPLPNRRNIVLTSKTMEHIESYNSIQTLIDKLTAEGVPEIFIIWWASIYAQFLPLADRIYLTEIKKAYVGDTYFPVFEDQFTETGRQVLDEMDFILYERK
jgi:dihydrofolate reductase